jgi:hypothetical protein
VESSETVIGGGFNPRYPSKVTFRSARSQNGGVSYVFADPAGCGCVYVGGGREYQEYQRLRLEQGIKNIGGFVWVLAQRHFRLAWGAA